MSVYCTAKRKRPIRFLWLDLNDAASIIVRIRLNCLKVEEVQASLNRPLTDLWFMRHALVVLGGLFSYRPWRGTEVKT
jgi:hypothetical protein